jgi:carboxypeptidase C (cathepsin A)
MNHSSIKGCVIALAVAWSMVTVAQAQGSPAGTLASICLLKAQRKTIGRLDARYVGPTMDPLQKYAEYDPLSEAISAAYTAAFLDYYHGELQFGREMTYQDPTVGIWEKWKWSHRPGGSAEQPIVNTGVDLGRVLVQDSNLRVLVLSGYFDLATPFSAMEYEMRHLGVPPGVSSRGT